MAAKKQQSDFWLRKNWQLSNKIKWSAGNVVITEGKYKVASAPARHARTAAFIMIFSRLDEDGADPTKSVDENTRLPNGHAIPSEKWPDLKRAFARFMMIKESKSKEEVDLMFDLSALDYKSDKIFFDYDRGERCNTPPCDDGRLQHSQKRAALIAEAIKDLAPYGMVDDRMSDAGSQKEAKKQKEPEPGPSAELSDAATAIITDSEDDDDEELDKLLKAKLASMARKNKKAKRSFTDVVLQGKKVSVSVA